jgi:hypothetical protein
VENFACRISWHVPLVIYRILLVAVLSVESVMVYKYHGVSDAGRLPGTNAMASFYCSLEIAATAFGQSICVSRAL